MNSTVFRTPGFSQSSSSRESREFLSHFDFPPRWVRRRETSWESQWEITDQSRGRNLLQMAGCALPLLGGALAALGAGTAVELADLAPVMTPEQLTTAVAGAIVRVREPVQC